MNAPDESEDHLVGILIHVGEAKRIFLLIAVMLFGWAVVINIAVFSDPESAFRVGQNLGFWELVLSITQRTGIWLLASCVLVVAWAMLTVGELYVAIHALSDDEPDVDVPASASAPPPPPAGLR